MSASVIIIGGGQASASCAFELRSLGYAGTIEIVSEEAFYPYHRPPLSKKYIAGVTDQDDLYIKAPHLYQEMNISVRLNTVAVSIDRAQKVVFLDDGDNLEYDYLVLATGASPRSLPPELGGDCRNVFTLRSLRDAKDIKKEFISGSHLLVIGGGYVGLETAAIARGMGLKVTLIEMADRVLSRVASLETANYFKNLHLQNAVSIFESTSLVDFARENESITSVKLSNNEWFDVDVLVVGIGVLPNYELAKDAGIDTENGIVVDEFSRTSDSSIFAAGDCSCFPYRGEHTRLESIQNAVDQAVNVARNIMEVSCAYEPQPWFWSDQYETKLQTAGLNRGYNEVIFRSSQKHDSSFSAWYFKNDEFLSVDAINDPLSFMVGKKLLKQGGSINKDILRGLEDSRELLA